jgi:hypothetical protein
MRNAIRSLLALLTAVATAGSACQLPCNEEPILFSESFELGLGDWMPGADVPQDPNRPGETVLWSIEPSATQPMMGLQSARFYLDGRQDDGTIWLARSFEVTPDREYTVSLRFWVWSELESFNTIAKVAAYTGRKDPTTEADFDTSQAANLYAGWREYTYSFRTTGSTVGELWIAFGISAVFETEMTYYIDNIHIEITPR